MTAQKQDYGKNIIEIWYLKNFTGNDEKCLNLCNFYKNDKIPSLKNFPKQDVSQTNTLTHLVVNLSLFYLIK